MARDLHGKVKRIRSLVDDPDLVAQNRAHLIDTASRLFRANGFHSTSTRDIALHAGFSVGAIYQYILKKEDLIVLILSTVVETYEQKIYPLADSEGTARERLSKAVDAYYRTLDEHHAKTDLLYHNFSGFEPSTKSFLNDLEERVTSIFRKILTQGVKDGEFKTINVVFVAHNIVSMAHMWALKRGRFRDVMSIDDYIAEQQRHLDAVLLPAR